MIVYYEDEDLLINLKILLSVMFLDFWWDLLEGISV